MIDLIGQPRIEVSKGIVREGREVKNCVETREVAALDVAKIFVQGGDVVDFADETIVSKKIAVQTHNLVGSLAQQPRQDRADVSMMASH
jgi:hypothetical protein